MDTQPTATPTTPPTPTASPASPSLSSQSYPMYDASPPGGSSGFRLSRGQMIGMAVGVVLAIVLSCALLVWLNSVGGLQALRDVLIIFLAFESILVFILLAWLMLQVQSLVEYMNNEVKPILGSVQESVNTVTTTTTFLQDSVVTPVIRARSTAAGVAQTFRALTRRR